MKSVKRLICYFSKGELVLWCSSVILIAVSFCVFDRENFLTLAASIIGVTSLIFNAKGNPFGQFLMVIFSLLYGIISFTFSYYGEMLTYLGMTMPMAVFALISWLRNPHNGNKADKGQQPRQKGNRVYVDTGCHSDRRLLFRFGRFQYRKHRAEYNFCHNKLCRRLPDLPEKSVFCTRVCRKRCGFNRFMGFGKYCGHTLYFGRRLLCRIPRQ